MAIDTETVKRVAFLSRLRIDDDKIEATKEELNEINTDNIEPLVAVNNTALRMRKDEVTAGRCKEAVLQNAPAAEYDYFAVPKVVE